MAVALEVPVHLVSIRRVGDTARMRKVQARCVARRGGGQSGDIHGCLVRHQSSHSFRAWAGSLPMAARGRRMEGSSRVLGRADLLSGDCVSTGVSALFFTYGRKCKK